jgi:mRNA interferase MazF
MPHYSKNDVILVTYPFSDLSSAKVRPAVVVHAPHPSRDSLIVPLTSKVSALLPGEFALADWEAAGLNVQTAVKRGIYTAYPDLIVKAVGKLSEQDAQKVEAALRFWLGLS